MFDHFFYIALLICRAVVLHSTRRGCPSLWETLTTQPSTPFGQHQLHALKDHKPYNHYAHAATVNAAEMYQLWSLNVERGRAPCEVDLIGIPPGLYNCIFSFMLQSTEFCHKWWNNAIQKQQYVVLPAGIIYID